MAEPRISTIESQRQAIQARLDAAKSAAERNQLGQFATPHALAVEIARLACSHIAPQRSDMRFADPAIGTGSFFSAALTVFGRARIASAIGVELDPTFAEAARDLWAGAGLEIVSGDFTQIVSSDACPPAPDLVLANPPYVRHHHLSPKEKKRLQHLAYRMTGIDVNGLAGLYVYFLLLATAWMKEGGYAAWLIPSEFMDVNYGLALKRYLTDRLTLIRTHRFDPHDIQFGDALVSSAVVLFKKAHPPAGHAPEFSFGGALLKPQARECVPLEQLRASHKWTVYPCHAKNDRHTLSTGNGPKLANLFRIQRGIATGNNKFFILDRADAQRRRLPEQYLRPILPSPRYLQDTVIESGEDGYPLIDCQLCVIDCDLPESVVERLHPPLWEYLQTADALGVRAGYIINKRVPWYRQEQRDPCPFLCTYMGRGAGRKQPFRFIHNRSKAIGTNLYLMLYPRTGLAAMLRKHPGRATHVHELLASVTGHELRGEGRVYGGGLHKIEPRELGRISGIPFIERWPELKASVRSEMTANLFD